jgi:cell division protein FtsL
VISYHSLEDRIVRTSSPSSRQGCTCPPDLPVCVCGNVPIVEVKTRKPDPRPSEEEVERNPRARSAKMRVAVKLDVTHEAATTQGLPEREPSRDFEVVEGRGLDARVRQGVSPQFMARVKAVVAVAALVIALGIVRVALSAATVSTLKASQSIESDIEQAQDLEAELRAERSVLGSSSRIERIATQNYGMSLATSTETITIGDASQGSTSSDQATASSDGDAAQASDSGDSAAAES